MGMGSIPTGVGTGILAPTKRAGKAAMAKAAKVSGALRKEAEELREKIRYHEYRYYVLD